MPVLRQVHVVFPSLQSTGASSPHGFFSRMLRQSARPLQSQVVTLCEVLQKIL
jgi:hypothetical protein